MKRLSITSKNFSHIKSMLLPCLFFLAISVAAQTAQTTPDTTPSPAQPAPVANPAPVAQPPAQPAPIANPAPAVQQPPAAVETAPAVQQAPVAQPAPVPAPAAQTAPVVQPAPVAQPADQPAPVAQQPAPTVETAPAAPVAQPETTLTPAPVAQPAPAVESAPVVETTPVAQPAPAAQPEPVAEQTPPAQTPSVVEPVAEPAPVAEPETAVKEVKEEAVTAEEEVIETYKKPVAKPASQGKKPASGGLMRSVSFPVNIQVQGSKYLYDEIEDEKLNNVDEWFGRVNTGILVQDGHYLGKVNLRIYPENFGRSYITSYTPSRDTTIYKDWKGFPLPVDSTIEETQSTSQITVTEVTEAWASYGIAKVGRFKNSKNNGKFFGNYLDNPLGGKFLQEAPSIDALELSGRIDERFLLSVQLESTDPNLNKGNIRAYAEFSRLTGLEAMEFLIGFRGNVFDQIKYSDAVFVSNWTLAAKLNLSKNLSLFAEGAITGIGAEDENGNDIKARVPVTGGVELPVTPVFDRAIIEAEWNYQRDKEILGSLYLQKDITPFFTFDAGLYSYSESSDLGMSLRMTSQLN